MRTLKPGIECVVKSVDEPQLERGLKAVYGQTIPFARVTHINNVSPEVKAHNMALEALVHEWSLWVDGDVILYKNAHELVIEAMKNYGAFTEYGFGLFDSFLQRVICCCPVRNTQFHSEFRYKDVLSNDTECAERMETQGWTYCRLWKKGVVVGTHFDNPSSFQVFRRFYGRGTKAIGKHKPIGRYRRELRQLFNETGDVRYRLALEAFNYALEKNDYPTSKDVDFERKVYETFCKDRGREC